jgi:hypothetical protein
MPKNVVAFAGFCFLHATIVLGQGNWTQQFPSQAPSGRIFHAMVFDEGRNEIVLFGGIDNSQVFGDTWLWNGSNWIQQFPAESPSPRFGQAMAYDAARQEVVLFGGSNGTIIGAGETETWVWNGATWTQVFPAISPPPRDLAAMTYDAARGKTVLFGGRNLSPGPGFGSELSDTWVWDGFDWTQVFPATHPSARIEHAITFDASRGEVVLFGGRLATFPSDFDDTWVWNGINWTQRFPATSPPPTGGHAIAYDAARTQVIMFGGYDNGAFSRSDTWSWSGTDWAQLTPATSPPGRANHALAYDSTLREIVLFGGGSPSASGEPGFNDTWVFQDIRQVPRTKDDCKRSGWTDLVRADGTPFKNQGSCVSYVNTGK